MKNNSQNNERINVLEVDYLNSNIILVEATKLLSEIENDDKWNLWALINISFHCDLMGVDWGLFSNYTEQMQINTFNMVLLTRLFSSRIQVSKGD